jgi:hypothetical protein
MAIIKPIKVKKDSPTNLAKGYFRNAHYLMNKKNDVTLGPRYVFSPVRVPQIKLF